MIAHVLIAMVAGWVNRHQQQVIAYLLEENRILKAQLGKRRLRLTDTQRRRLAALAHLCSAIIGSPRHYWVNSPQSMRLTRDTAVPRKNWISLFFRLISELFRRP